MTPTRTSVVATLVITGIVAICLIAVFSPGDDADATGPQTPPSSADPAPGASEASGGGTPQPTPIPAPAPVTVPVAIKAYKDGVSLYESEKWLEAREALSHALRTGVLPAAEVDHTRQMLTNLAELMIFSSVIYDNDPYVDRYVILPGDTLGGVERKLTLRVPAQLLQKINNIPDATKIRAGQAIKVIRGPFHAIITKSDFAMDLYLQRDELLPVFVGRLRVGLGKNGTTPTGMWRVSPGKKLTHAPWNPPVSSGTWGKVLWGDPNYPLGTKGYWISLAGIDDDTRNMEGYGIHGTDDPTSIGRADSLGCIRLSDPDIELVFSLLYEQHSTVEVRP